MIRIRLPKGISSAEKNTLLSWRDPVVFFNDVTGDPPFSYQAEILRDIPNVDILRMLMCAAGNTGKTRLLASIALWSSTILSNLILFQPYSVIIESGSLEQSRTLYDYLRTWLETNDILKKLVKGDPLKTNTVFYNGSFIKALPASWKSIFGQHSDLIIIDEAVEAGTELLDDSIRVIGTALYQGKNIGRAIFSSTPHDYNAKFVEMWDKTSKYPDWKRYSWSVLECPKWTQKAIEDMKTRGNMYFQIFGMGKPYPLMGTMIPIKQILSASQGVGIFDYDPEWGYCVMGVDWGFAPDPTAIIIIQRNDELKQIRVLYNKDLLKEDPDRLLDKLETLYKNYKVERIFTDSHNKHMNIFLTKRGLPVSPISFTGEKGMMETNLATKFEQGIIKVPEAFVKLNWQLRQYTYGKKRDDDLVAALMLAVRDYKKEYGGEIYFKKFKPSGKRQPKWLYPRV